MAASDARPVPRRGEAFRVYFPILDADGDPVSGAASLDSEVSLDGAAFADCTNEATEIGTSGLYYLDLTVAEMTADAVIIRVQTATAGAKTTPMVLYPEEAGDYRAAVTSMGAGVLDAAAIAADAITAAKVAADVGTEIRTGLATSAEITALDAVVDTVKVDTAAILVDTAEIGAAGAGLSAVPWNASWDAEVQSEVADGLAAYDPPTKAELDAAVAPLALEASLAVVDANVDAVLVDTAALDARVPSDPADQSLIIAATTAVQSAIAALNNISTADLAAALATYDGPTKAELDAAVALLATAAELALVKAKTDSLTFTTGGQVDANVQSVNDVALDGAGTLADPWGPA